MQKRWMICLIAALIFLGGTCRAAPEVETETESLADAYLDDLDLAQIQQSLDEMFPEQNFDFKESVLCLIKGESPVTAQALQSLLISLAAGELTAQREVILRILILAVISSVFANFVRIFEGSQLSDIAFYMIYLLLFALLMKSFGDLSSTAADGLKKILHFMKLLLPAYLVAASLAAGSVMAAGFYELTLLIIAAAQALLSYVVLPGIRLYVLFLLLNNLSREDYLSKLAELMKLMIHWLLKTLPAAVVGVQTIQALLLPAIDSLKNGIWKKAAGAVPMLGNTLNAVTETVLGSALLLKNAVGTAGMIVIALLCLMSAIRLAVCALLYKAASAAVQPVSDKRITECIAGVGEGTVLLLRTVAVTGIMLLLTMAIVTASIQNI